jgi:elongation factor 1-delta
MSLPLIETVWLEGPLYNNSMDKYQQHIAQTKAKACGDATPTPSAEKITPVTESKQSTAPVVAKKESTLVNQIQATRNTIKASLNGETVPSVNSDELLKRINAVENENVELKKELSALVERFAGLEARISNLSTPGAAPAAPAPVSVSAPQKAEEEEDDDIDLFGSDEEEDDGEAERLKEQRIKEYNDKKAAKEAKKGALIAKSNIILDVKPWDDETDMAEIEKQVRQIETDGLLWGASKLVAIGYGIKKLQICCVVVDDKVGTDFLEEEITAIEDLVQSVDVAAFNKI